MSNVFHEPVTVLVGLGFPRRIDGPLDAVIFLNDVPDSARTSAHSMALKACKAALTGEIEAETARGAFRAYAQKQDILAPNTSEFLAARALRGRDPHTL
jgi:hypothetical protein